MIALKDEVNKIGKEVIQLERCFSKSKTTNTNLLSGEATSAIYRDKSFDLKTETLIETLLSIATAIEINWDEFSVNEIMILEKFSKKMKEAIDTLKKINVDVENKQILELINVLNKLISVLDDTLYFFNYSSLEAAEIDLNQEKTTQAKVSEILQRSQDVEKNNKLDSGELLNQIKKHGKTS